MTTRDFTIAFEIAIGLFALYLFVRRFMRIARSEPPEHSHDEDQEHDDEGDNADQ